IATDCLCCEAHSVEVFHDPVHGQIELPQLLVKIIDTPQFQRLRSIKQLGGASFVYPGGDHTRFEHSIGVAYLAGELAKALRSRHPKLIDDKDILCVQIAGLCHDLGHGPFSHLFDQMFIPRVLGRQNQWEHEKASQELFDHLVKEYKLEDEIIDEKIRLEKEDLTFIKEMINPTKVQDKWPFEGRGEEKSFLYEIVSNKLSGIDVDKFDYLERDCLHMGLKNTFDFRRFFLFARVCKVDGRNHICLRETEVGNLYDLFYSRYSLHRRVCQHRVTQNVNLMITDAFVKADPILNLSGAISIMEEYTNLTDEVFEKILHSTGPDLQEAREILRNIHKRKLYKFVGEAKVYKTLNPNFDPVRNVFFYRKDAPETGLRILRILRIRQDQVKKNTMSLKNVCCQYISKHLT
uniref:HD domain-containing protein n=1 Tax=Salarias fasciatus TaxID=181472 RepID=A0A672J2R4_SALFA